MTERRYPDNTELHARKSQWRSERASMSFSEKLDALDALKERVEPIVRAREARGRAAPQSRRRS